jgi:hypothetical protein
MGTSNADHIKLMLRMNDNDTTHSFAATLMSQEIVITMVMVTEINEHIISREEVSFLKFEVQNARIHYFTFQVPTLQFTLCFSIFK